jgi:ribonuclease III
MTPERSAALRRLEERLSYAFHDRGLLEQALTHRSFVHENLQATGGHNERLEFLGDAVLQLCLSRLLMEKHATYTEGQLSRLRASFVNEQSLSELAKGLRLGDFLLLGRGEELHGGRMRDSILADAFEAVLAAMFLDGGYERAYGFVAGIFAPLVDRGETPPFRDYKTALQEECMRRFRAMPRYTLIGQYGPEHARTFEVRLDVAEGITVTGRGHSKKEAEQGAARQALAVMEKAPPEGDGL